MNNKQSNSRFSQVNNPCSIAFSKCTTESETRTRREKLTRSPSFPPTTQSETALTVEIRTPTTVSHVLYSKHTPAIWQTKRTSTTWTWRITQITTQIWRTESASSPIPNKTGTSSKLAATLHQSLKTWALSTHALTLSTAMRRSKQAPKLQPTDKASKIRIHNSAVSLLAEVQTHLPSSVWLHLQKRQLRKS